MQRTSPTTKSKNGMNIALRYEAIAMKIGVE
jgi:hypothetical protein